MNILGINAYHAGASACLIQDGQLIAAAEEERFNRRKYWAGFPSNAIRYVLHEAGISVHDLDHVGISRKPNARLMEKILYAMSKRPSIDLIRRRLENKGKVTNLRAELSAASNVVPESISAEFHEVEHHLAHMASAFLVSPFEDAAVLSVDGMGDFVSTMWGRGSGNQLRVDGTVTFPHSLGFFYTAVSQWLGFPKYGDEGKVMGLAPYGRPRYVDEMHQIVHLMRDGSFELNLDYFVVHSEGVTMSWDDGEPVLGNLFSDQLVELLGEPRIPTEPITEKHRDAAASLQEMLEEAGFSLLNRLQKETGEKAICMAGGVALNSAFNGKILPQTDFDDIWIQPAAGDSGTALGVCYYIWNCILNNPRKYVMNNAYTGPEFTNDHIGEVLDSRGLKCLQLEDDELVNRAVELVAQGNVLGWFQGRMEWGPRALGNRSIIADPRKSQMKDTLNARIKHREKFRPFAPSILLEHVAEYFDQSYPDPFMLKVYNVLPGKQEVIPAVTHIDGTGRLQTVDKAHSSMYWNLINAFKVRTGVPVVLNTSFNENEPIVCAPQEAVDCYLRTRMDALAIGNFLVSKTDGQE